jgi:hypothetical protein
LKGKISKGMCEKEKTMIKEIMILKRYFKNSCKSFAFSSKWGGERICVGRNEVIIILIDGINICA